MAAEKIWKNEKIWNLKREAVLVIRMLVKVVQIAVTVNLAKYAGVESVFQMAAEKIWKKWKNEKIWNWKREAVLVIRMLVKVVQIAVTVNLAKYAGVESVLQMAVEKIWKKWKNAKTWNCKREAVLVIRMLVKVV